MGSKYDEIMKILSDGDWHKDVWHKLHKYFKTSKHLERRMVYDKERKYSYMVYRRTDV